MIYDNILKFLYEIIVKKFWPCIVCSAMPWCLQQAAFVSLRKLLPTRGVSYTVFTAFNN